MALLVPVVFSCVVSEEYVHKVSALLYGSENICLVLSRQKQLLQVCPLSDIQHMKDIARNFSFQWKIFNLL